MRGVAEMNRLAEFEHLTTRNRRSDLLLWLAAACTPAAIILIWSF
jgi:hypothetical protein